MVNLNQYSELITASLIICLAVFITCFLFLIAQKVFLLAHSRTRDIYLTGLSIGFFSFSLVIYVITLFFVFYFQKEQYSIHETLILTIFNTFTTLFINISNRMIIDFLDRIL